MESMELETSIGTLAIEAGGRDTMSLKSPGELGDAWPHVYLDFERTDDRWEAGAKPHYHSGELIGETRFDRSSMPQALFDELSRLGIEWADAHPEEFERAAREEFEDWIGYICHDTFDDLVAKFEEAQKNFRKILDEPEFKFHASNKLLRRVKHEAQRIRTMRLQVSGAAKAIRTLAARCVEREEALSTISKIAKIADPEDRAVALIGLGFSHEEA